MGRIETIALIISLISAAAAIWSAIVAIQATKQARNSVTASILLDLTESYATKEMNDAVHYIVNLRSEHTREFAENPYVFARKYLTTISPNSPEWQMRRKLSHFYNHLATLVEGGIIDEKAIFSIWAATDISIIEFLEPIETAIQEKYYSLPYRNNEWTALRLLHRCQKWEKRQPKKKDPRFTLPRNTKLYAQSLEKPKDAI